MIPFGIGMPGIPELIIVFLIVLVLFGAGKLPQVFKSFGEGIKQFKDAQQGKPEEDPVDVTPPKSLAEKAPEAEEIKEIVK
jgi:sec-independent protein translocase protein TatA